jgi:hypothetical protein
VTKTTTRQYKLKNGEKVEVVKVEEMGFERPSDIVSNLLPPYPFFTELFQDVFGVIEPLVHSIID